MHHSIETFKGCHFTVRIYQGNNDWYCAVLIRAGRYGWKQVVTFMTYDRNEAIVIKNSLFRPLEGLTATYRLASVEMVWGDRIRWTSEYR